MYRFDFKLHISIQSQDGSPDRLTSSQDQDALANDSIKSWYPSGTVACASTHPANAGTSAFTSRNLASNSSRWKSEIRFTKERFFVRSIWLFNAFIVTWVFLFSIGKVEDSGPCNITRAWISDWKTFFSDYALETISIQARGRQESTYCMQESNGMVWELL